MLQKIRDSLQGQKWLAGVVLGALALVFAAWGAYGIVNLNLTSGSYAAKVEGEKVPLEEVRQAWSQQQAQWGQRFGGELPDTFKQQLQNQLLEEMVRALAMSEHAHGLGYRVTAEQIHHALREVPAFQIDGQYNPNVARERLAQAGLSLPAFEMDLRRGLLRTQIQKGIQTSDFVTPSELARLHALEDEQREVRYATFKPDQFAGDAKIDDKAVLDYYQKHQSSYLTPESVKLAYGELRLDQLAAQVPVTDAELRAAYDKTKDRYVQTEKRRVRHILIKEGPDALKKAEGILAEAKSGKDFGALAKQYSQDVGSAPQGGDLGFEERGNLVKPFEDALFGMKPGEIRGPVKTQYGYHIIKLEEVQPGKTRSFDEARTEVDAQLRRDKAQDQLGDIQEQISRKLEESGSDFDTLVKEFGLQGGVVADFQRGAGGAPLGAAPELQEVVFSDPVLNEKRMGGPVALGEDRLVIVKALEHHPPAPKPLAEVRNDIVAALRKEQGAAAAEKAADAVWARLRSGASFDEVAKEKGVKVEPARFMGRKDPSVPAAIRTLVFASPRPAGQPIYHTVKLDDGGIAVVALTATRLDPNGTAADRKTALTQEIAASRGAGDVAAYLEEVRRQAKVVKNPKAFD